MNEQGCGKRKEPSVTRRIVGGNEAKIEEFPWHVGLEMPDSGKIECGATLINREWAVSAGHCFKPFVVKPKFIDEENSRSPDCYPVMPKFRGKFKAVFGEDDQGGKSPHERKRGTAQPLRGQGTHPYFEKSSCDANTSQRFYCSKLSAQKLVSSCSLFLLVSSCYGTVYDSSLLYASHQT